jgi:hypothetical protein
MDLCARVYESRQKEGRGAWIYVQECTKEVGEKKEGGHGSMCKSAKGLVP